MDNVRIYFTTCTDAKQEVIFFANLENRLLNEEDGSEDFSLSDLVPDMRRLALTDELRSAYETKDIIPAGKDVVVLGSDFKPPGNGLTPYRVKDVRVIAGAVFKEIVHAYSKQKMEYDGKISEICNAAEYKIKQIRKDESRAAKSVSQPDLQGIVYQTLATK